MYDFIKIQYKLGTIDERQVMAYVPKWITYEQAREIINVDLIYKL